MSLINMILLGSTLGIVLCLNPFRRRPQHVVLRRQLARERERMPAHKWSSGKV